MEEVEGARARMWRARVDSSLPSCWESFLTVASRFDRAWRIPIFSSVSPSAPTRTLCRGAATGGSLEAASFREARACRQHERVRVECLQLHAVKLEP
ncbi:MAG: hypothetical protein QW407_02200 [Thermofilaceae archaeon]